MACKAQMRLESGPVLAIRRAVMDAQATDRARRDYVDLRILSAHPVEIVNMLYQLGMDSLNSALAHLKDGNALARARAVTRAQGAVNELMLALDHEAGAPFSRTLAELYAYVQEQIIRGHTQQSEQAFREALSILKTLAEGWSGVAANICGGDPAAGTPHAPDRPQTKDQSTAYGSSLSLPVTSRDWDC
jgi:flagellar biosynthetic protein FliS